MKPRELVLISILILLIPFALYFWMGGNGVGDLGSLLGAASGLLAVIWFYRSLRLQSIQIKEQKEQFIKQHHIQLQDSLLTFLDKSSERMEEYHSDLIKSLGISEPSHLVGTYIDNVQYFKDALESTDPEEVMSKFQSWMKIEGPCVKFMSAVRDIIILHDKRLGISKDSDGVDPADFVFINGAHLMEQPFMSAYQVSVNLLSEQMMLITPGRNAMILASMAAAAQIYPEGYMKTDKIIEDIKKAKSNGLLVPRICDVLYC